MTVSRRIRLVGVVFGLLAYMIFAVVQQGGEQPVSASPYRLPLAYTGVDYYYPTDYFTGCANFSWLQNQCYDNAALKDSPRQQLLSDLDFVQASHVAGSMRVWISLDSLMNWNAATGFAGFQPGVLSNVDDMLSIFHQYGIKLDLVLYQYSPGETHNAFRPEALDGFHNAMRRNYLRALSVFMTHLSQNAVDTETAPLIELQNEPYFQLEQYFRNPDALGKYGSCAHNGVVNTWCVDKEIIRPWLGALYDTARAAAPTGFLFSFSDTGRLFNDYARWGAMYPGDIINEHVYDSTPWAHEQRYARALHFQQPWIVTEAGCNVGRSTCTYSGNVSTGGAAVDSWWLQHLGAYGAQSVMLESHVSLWTYPDGPLSATPTVAGESAIKAVEDHVGPTIPGSIGPKPQPVMPESPTKSTMFNNFDHVSPGPYRISSAARSTVGAVGASDLVVESGIFQSAPNALEIPLSSPTPSFISKYPAWTGTGFRLRFGLRLGMGSSVRRNGYVDLTQLRLGNSTMPAARVNLLLGSKDHISTCVTVSGAIPRCAVVRTVLARGTWQNIGLTSSGPTVALRVNGGPPVVIVGVSLPATPVTYAAFGDGPGSRAIKSHGVIYVDNLSISE
jgi:hypothetical protein